VNKQYFADMYSTWPSSIWVTPVKDDVDGIIAYTPSFNYTISQIPQLMYKAKLYDTGDLKLNTYNEKSWNTANDPGAKVYCWYSPTVPTIVAHVWTDDSLSDESRMPIMGGGDGVVHYHGLRVCDKWKNTEQWIYENIPHAAEIGTDWVIDRIIKIVSGMQQCSTISDEYTSDCGEECNAGDMEIGEEGCGFFNTKEAKRCLKVLRWQCEYNCGQKVNTCVKEYNGDLERTSNDCADGKETYYEECKKQAESQGSPFFTYYGDYFPAGCFTIAGDATKTLSFNYKLDSATNCTADQVDSCFCRM